MSGFRRGTRRSWLTFDSALDVVEADVTENTAAYTPTETIAVVPAGPDETMILDSQEPEPEPEPELLPHAGYAIGPRILTEHEEWRSLFPFPPPEEAPEDAPRYGWVDVSEATRDAVDEFLGVTWHEWCTSNDGTLQCLRVSTDTPPYSVTTAHAGDRIFRDEDGLRVECARAFEDWETGSFQAADAAIAAGQGDCA